MDLRYFFWILVGAFAFESPYRDLVAIIAVVIYSVGVLMEGDISGLSFGLNNVGIWFVIIPYFEFDLNVFAVWVILCSVNYLVVKNVWTRILKK